MAPGEATEFAKDRPWLISSTTSDHRLNNVSVRLAGLEKIASRPMMGVGKPNGVFIDPMLSSRVQA
jgi:hypothetical protein